MVPKICISMLSAERKLHEYFHEYSDFFEAVYNFRTKTAKKAKGFQFPYKKPKFNPKVLPTKTQKIRHFGVRHHSA